MDRYDLSSIIGDEDSDDVDVKENGTSVIKVQNVIRVSKIRINNIKRQRQIDG
jgi:hypothetical protein